MRRFSQKHQLVTLSDINVTPLLDLSFVLLIIFMIATPLLEKGITLQLPVGGGTDAAPPDPERIHVLDVSSEGTYYYRQEELHLPELEARLGSAHAEDPDLIVYLRGDRISEYGRIYDLLSMLEDLGISNVSFRGTNE